MIWQDLTISFFMLLFVALLGAFSEIKILRSQTKNTKNCFSLSNLLSVLSNHRYHGIPFQAIALNYRTKYLLEDNKDNLWAQINLIFVFILDLLSVLSREK